MEAAALYRCFLLDKIAAGRALVGAQPVVASTPDEARAESWRLLAVIVFPFVLVNTFESWRAHHLGERSAC